MHILQIIKGLDIGGQNGGSETFGLNLSRHLQMNGWHITLCSFYRYHTQVEKNWCEQLEKLGIEVIFANPDSHTHFFRSVKRLSVKCREKKIALIHSHNQTGTLAALILKMIGVVPCVIRTAHITQEWGTGLVPWAMRQMFTNWIYPIFVNAEVVVSEAIVTQLKHHPGARLTRRHPIRIYNGIDSGWIEKPAAHQEDRGRDDVFVIGSVGRLTDRKGYHFLLEAYATVVRSYPNTKLILIGDGENRPKLEAQAFALGVRDYVDFLGQRSDVQDLLKAFDLFVLPSLQEGLPTVLLESMASGIPVIATDIPGTRELVNHNINGWLVPLSDSAALADKIQQAIQSPDILIRMSEMAVTTLQKFTFREISNQYENLYRRLLTENEKNGSLQ